MRSLLEQLEANADDTALAPAVVYAAGQAVGLDEDDRRGAVRRAMLVLAAGGDPHRELSEQTPAAATLAADIDDRERRLELEEALDGLRRDAAGLPRVTGTLEALLADGERTWRLYAVVLLADEIDEA